MKFLEYNNVKLISIVFAIVVAKLSDSFETPWTVAHQFPLSMEFSSQAYWSGLPFPSLRDLPDSGIELESPGFAGRFFTTESPGKP